MASPDPLLKRFTPLRGNLTSRGSVWYGAGQIVLAEQTLASETYKRFLVDDLFALVAWETRHRAITRWVLGVLGTLVTLWAALADASLILTLGMGCLTVLLLGINEWRGPTVAVLVVTPVQRVRLWPMRRRREWEKLAQALREAYPQAAPVAPIPEDAPPPLP